MKKHCSQLMILILVLISVAAWADAPPDRKRVVVLGFDGADPGLTRKYMEEGYMPHFSRLEQEGTFHDLTVTNPPQTPVSWGTFMTSWNPGRTQIFDFLKRDVGTYKPSFVLMEEGSKTIFLGENNRWAVPLACFLAFFLLPLLLRAVWHRGKIKAWLAAAVLLGIVGGALGIWFATLLPNRVPLAINNRKGKPFWEYAADAGLQALVFRVPDTFPAHPFYDGRLVAGLGVPDMRGRVGTPYIFTTDTLIGAGDNEFSVELVFLDYTQIPDFETTIKGPFNKPFFEYAVEDSMDVCTDPDLKEEVRAKLMKRFEEKGIDETIDLPLCLTWDEEGATVTFEVQGKTETLKQGQWSQWVDLEFRFNPLVHLTGMARFYLISADSNFTLYMSPIHFHPCNHGIPISYPPEYAEELLKRFGYYKTMGWAVDTWTISSGLVDEDQFLSDMNLTVDAYARMMKQLLRDGDWDLYVQVYEYTDRIGHILWQYMDPEHPIYDAEKAPHFQMEMRKAYQKMDTIVGEAIEAVGPGVPILIVSDHGFASFRKGVNYNRWLIDNGYMTLKDETGILTLEDLFDDDRLLFKNVDWAGTRVYALGLGNLYINLKGREREGIVSPGQEYDDLVAELKEKMPLLVDPETGDRPIHAVYHRDDIYRLYDPDLIPDLRVTNTPGYRVSWQTSLGGAPEAIIEENRKAWSGDHCSLDPSFVPGICLGTMDLRENPNMLDIAPTVLALLGVPVPETMEGTPLIE